MQKGSQFARYTHDFRGELADVLNMPTGTVKLASDYSLNLQSLEVEFIGEHSLKAICHQVT